MAKTHLESTNLLDFQHERIQRLIAERGWASLAPRDAIGAIYTFVRDEIRFGYNLSDDIPASRVLSDGYGQCNTKTTLLMALLRAVGIPCRFHSATIDKRLQKGVPPGLFYAIAPRNIIHSWAEVSLDGRWIALEGVILDRDYVDGVRARFPDVRGAFLGFAIGTDNLAAPANEWRGEDTAIQQTGVNQDFGVFDDPDDFYARHGANLSGVKRWLFQRWIRHSMNASVAKIRDGRLDGQTCTDARPQMV